MSSSIWKMPFFIFKKTGLLFFLAVLKKEPKVLTLSKKMLFSQYPESA